VPPPYLEDVRRLALTCLAVASLAMGCGSDDDEQPAATPALADLRVAVDRDGKGGKPAQTSTVRCSAADASPQCEKVAALRLADLEPASGATACTELYGGPETATITGTLRGERVNLKLTRVNGCEIARWEAARALLQ
jgi:hypothetical protein